MSLSRDELLPDLKRVLQETDPHRLLDSIEAVSVRAHLAGRGLDYPDGVPLPNTMEGWVEWAVHSSMAS